MHAQKRMIHVQIESTSESQPDIDSQPVAFQDEVLFKSRN